ESQEEAERLRALGQDLLLVRGRRVAAAAGGEARGREPDRLRLRLSALGQLVSAIAERDSRSRRSERRAEAQDPQRQRPPPLQPEELAPPGRAAPSAGP